MIKKIIILLCLFISIKSQVIYTEDFSGNVYDTTHFFMKGEFPYIWYVENEQIKGTYGSSWNDDQQDYSIFQFRTIDISSKTSHFDIRARLKKDSNNGNRYIFVGLWRSPHYYAGITVDNVYNDGKVSMIINNGGGQGTYAYLEDTGLSIGIDYLYRVVYDRDTVRFYYDNGGWQLLGSQPLDFGIMQFYPLIGGGIFNALAGDIVRADDFYVDYTPFNTDSLQFTAPSPDIGNIVQRAGGDTMNISWYSTTDSARLYFLGDSVKIADTNGYAFVLPDTVLVGAYLIGKPLSDSLYTPYLGDTIVYSIYDANNENQYYFKIDTSYFDKDSVYFDVTSTNLDTLEFWLEQVDYTWYRLGEIAADTSQYPNKTHYSYPLVDHSPICKCRKGGGGGGAPWSGDYFNPITDTVYTINSAILRAAGAFTADPVYRLMCHGWYGNPWDLTYKVDITCGWVAETDEQAIERGHKWEGTGMFTLDNWGNSVEYSRTSTKSKTYGEVTIKNTTTEITSKAFTYSLNGYDLILTSTLTGQSRSFDLKSLDVNMNAAFLGGSGAIHPPFAIKVEKVGGVQTLWIGQSPPGRALFYIFQLDSRFAMSVDEYSEKSDDAYFGAFDVWQYDGGVSTSQTKFRGVHSADGIWKYGNQSGEK